MNTKLEPFSDDNIKHNYMPPLAISEWQSIDDCSGNFSTNVELDISQSEEVDHSSSIPPNDQDHVSRDKNSTK